MSDQTTIYDIGKIEPVSIETYAEAAVAPDRTAPLRTAVPVGRAMPRPEPATFDLYGTLSLFVPGSGQLLRGEVAWGLFLMSALGFMAALGWALMETLESVTVTSRLLGLPGGPGVWGLCAVFIAAATLHLASVASSGSSIVGGRSSALPPVVSGLASAVLPGWGQVLNGCYARACLFVAALWLIAAAWILAIPGCQVYLESIRLFIPDWVLLLTSPAVRYTVPAVVWTLAIYDAATTAAGRR
jgi:TM2 domain-containing membrane protein YozV